MKAFQIKLTQTTKKSIITYRKRKSTTEHDLNWSNYTLSDLNGKVQN